MFDFLPLACKEMHANIRDIYWIMLPPYTVLTLVLEFFNMPGKNPDAGGILKRVAVSIILLLSLEPCLNTIAMVADGIVEKVQSDAFSDLLRKLENNYQNVEVSWFKFKEALIFTLGLLSYVLAFVGVLTATALIHFAWAILYVCSPLMILMNVSPRTSFVTTNLYKGILNVMVWKVLASILGTLLLKMITSPAVGDWSNFLITVSINLCIGISMLLIPLATKSLIGDGMTTLASGLAVAPAYATGRVVKELIKKQGKRAMTGLMAGGKKIVGR